MLIHGFINLTWRNTMPVQMIELEEVEMVEVSDEALEAMEASEAVRAYTFTCSAQGC
jgi:hypothetical protein